MKSPTLQGPEFVVSADWSKDQSKRSVHVADVRARTITEQHGKWSLAAPPPSQEGVRGLHERAARSPLSVPFARFPNEPAANLAADVTTQTPGIGRFPPPLTQLRRGDAGVDGFGLR